MAALGGAVGAAAVVETIVPEAGEGVIRASLPSLFTPSLPMTGSGEAALTLPQVVLRWLLARRFFTRA